jgi:hypothetical protein
MWRFKACLEYQGAKKLETRDKKNNPERVEL